MKFFWNEIRPTWFSPVEFSPFIDGPSIIRIRHSFGCFAFFMANIASCNIIRGKKCNILFTSLLIIWRRVTTVQHWNRTRTKFSVFKFATLDSIQILHRWTWRSIIFNWSKVNENLLRENERATVSKCRWHLKRMSALFFFSLLVFCLHWKKDWWGQPKKKKRRDKTINDAIALPQFQINEVRSIACSRSLFHQLVFLLERLSEIESDERKRPSQRNNSIIFLFRLHLSSFTSK